MKRKEELEKTLNELVELISDTERRRITALTPTEDLRFKQEVERLRLILEDYERELEQVIKKTQVETDE